MSNVVTDRLTDWSDFFGSDCKKKKEKKDSGGTDGTLCSSDLGLAYLLARLRLVLRLARTRSNVPYRDK